MAIAGKRNQKARNLFGHIEICRLLELEAVVGALGNFCLEERPGGLLLMAAVQWPALLRTVLKEKGAEELPENKAVKYAVKAAQLLHGEASKGALKAGLRAYLARCGCCREHPTLGGAHVRQHDPKGCRK